MPITVLSDVLIARGEIDRLYQGEVPVTLWRSMNVKHNKSPMEFVEKGFVMSNGRPRKADITITTINEVEWVHVKDRPRGLSTFDKPGLPRGRDWEYYKIPKGTKLPAGLVIVRDEYNEDYRATHYTLAPATDMPLEHFKGLLTQLAISLRREAV
jgi:hypothetical protein